MLQCSNAATQLWKMPSAQNVRRLVLTAAVTSITIAGTLYGAGLKTNEEISEVNRILLSHILHSTQTLYTSSTWDSALCPRL